MKQNTNNTVFVAMSGGVDSSVAALLLKQRGYDVVGIFMRCYNVDGCAERDATDARRVAEQLDIPFYVWDFEADYKDKVVSYMIEEYRNGRTPNPDVECNRTIKFGLFLDKALSMGADFIATGHYVRLEKRDERKETSNLNPLSSFHFSLSAARDSNKDQSYFLWALTQEQLRHCLFPIGDFIKSDVRMRAREAGLSTADKKDSQGICFLGKVTLNEFLATYLPQTRGAVLNVAGERIGEHNGAQFYTIGQRHGYKISGKRKENREKYDMKPHYIARKDAVTNTLTVAEGDDDTVLYQKEIELRDVNFINPQFAMSNFVIDAPARVFARTRYRQPLAVATITLINSEEHPRQSACSSASICVLFEEPQKAIAPGQSAVFYADDGTVLGGGIIT